MQPDSWFYTQLRDNLAFYRIKAGNGEAAPLQAQKTLRQGDSGAEVTALRQRLVELDLHPPLALGNADFFGPRLHQAVALFQSMHGKEVPAELIPWSEVSATRFPYRVVQQPGPQNALGRIKFMFPNRHAIYLHDTPNQELFQRASRAFSAGCVRVEDPLQLADRLLGDDWQPAAIQAAVDSAELQVIHLPQPVDVLLMYWTVSPAQRGRIKYNPDIYNRDPKVLERLNAPPVWKNI